MKPFRAADPIVELTGPSLGERFRFGTLPSDERFTQRQTGGTRG
jgi:hypothetical protein